MVTIGLPVYNGERWLKEAINSVLAQTYEDWELIVTIDELGVRSEELGAWLSEELGNKDERIRIIADGVHRGISARINQQVALARGEYFARMDADDVMMPTRLEKQVALLNEHPETEVVSCSAIIIDEMGEKLGERSEGIIHPSVMGRTGWFRQNPYNEEYSGVEDYELWLRVKNTVNIAHINEPLMYYRERTHYNLQKVWHERMLGIRMIWHERHLYGSIWRALMQILNNIMVMVTVPVIHLLHLDRWVILRRNS